MSCFMSCVFLFFHGFHTSKPIWHLYVQEGWLVGGGVVGGGGGQGESKLISWGGFRLGVVDTYIESVWIRRRRRGGG